MNPLAKTVFFLAVLVMSSLGCAEQSMNSKKVEKLIEESLDVGAGQKEIERFLEDNEIIYSYDDFNKRYQCIIRDPSPKKPTGYHSIVIHIYVDEEMQFKRAEVRDSYTVL